MVSLLAVTKVADALSFGGLYHVAALINAYVDTTSLVPLVTASLRGYPRLVLRLLSSTSPRLDSRYVAYVCNQGIDEAAFNEQLDIIQQFVRHFPALVLTGAVRAAARGGQPQILSWLREQGAAVLWPSQAILDAARTNLATLQWFGRRFDIATDPKLLSAAVSTGDPTLAQYVWLLFSTSERNELYLSNAVPFVPAALAAWMLQNTKVPLDIFLDDTAARGDLLYLRWTRTVEHRVKSITATSAAMDLAARNGHHDVVVWLHKYCDANWTASAFEEAASNGRLHVLQWLQKRRNATCSPSALVGAAVNNHLELLSWMLSTFADARIPPRNIR